ncbi:MAG: hypothetical protein DRJ37_02745 [Thermoprotei archaeon]|nr:MAG: hypothetical protein DRJ37_02745 [Thermoprotei archaeon]
MEYELKNFTIEYGVYEVLLNPYDFFYYKNGTGSYRILPSSFILEISKGTIWAIYSIESNQSLLELKLYREYISGIAYLEVSSSDFNYTVPIDRGSGYLEYEFTIDQGSLNIKFKLYPEAGLGRIRVGNIRLKMYNKAETLSHVAICVLNAPYCKHIIKTPSLKEEAILRLPSGYTNVTVDGKSSPLKIVLEPNSEHTIIAYTKNDINLTLYSDGVEDRYFKPGSLINIEVSPPENGTSRIKVYKNGETIFEEDWDNSTIWSLKVDSLGDYEVFIEWKGDYFCVFQSRKFTVTDLLINYTIKGEPITGLEIDLIAEVTWLHNRSIARNVIVYLNGEEYLALDGVAEFNIASESSGLKRYTLIASVINSTLSSSVEVEVEWVGFNVEILDARNGTIKNNKVEVYGSDRVELLFSISMTNSTIPDGLFIVIDETGDKAMIVNGSFSFTVVGLDKISLYVLVGGLKVKVGEYSIIFVHPGIRVLLDDYYFQVGTEAKFEVEVAWMHNGTPIPGVKVRLGEYENTTDEQGRTLLIYSGDLGEHKLNITADLGWTKVKRSLRLIFTYLIIKGEEEVVTNKDEEEVVLLVKYAHSGEPVPGALVAIDGEVLRTDKCGRVRVVLNASPTGEVYEVTAEKNRLKTATSFVIKVYKLKVLIKDVESDGLLLRVGGEYVVASAPGTTRTLKITIEGEGRALKLDGQVVKGDEGVFVFTLGFPSELEVVKKSLYLVEEGREYPLAKLVIASVEPEVSKAMLVSSNYTHWIVRVTVSYTPLGVPAQGLTLRLLNQEAVTDEKGEAVFCIKRTPPGKLIIELKNDPLGSFKLHGAEIGEIKKLKISYELTGTNLNLKITVKTTPPVQGVKIISEKTTSMTDLNGKVSLEYKVGTVVIVDPSPIENLEELYYVEPQLINATLNLSGEVNASSIDNRIRVTARVKCLQPVQIEELEVLFKVIGPKGEEEEKIVKTEIPIEGEAVFEEEFEVEREGEYRIEVFASAPNTKPFISKTSIYVRKKLKIETLITILIVIVLIIFAYLLLKRKEKGYEELEF